MKRIVLAVFLVALMLGGGPAQATEMFWGINGGAQGGAGNWTTAAPAASAGGWGTAAAGPFTAGWVNATDDATFGGTAAGVTVTTPSTVRQIKGITGYALHGSTLNTLTFAAGGSVSIASGSMSINGKYAGSWTKLGAGTVTINNSAATTSKYIVNAGALAIAAPNRITGGADQADFFTLNGGELNFNTTTAFVLGRSITLGASGGTLRPTSAAITLTVDKKVSGTSGGNLTLNGGTAHVLSNTQNDWNGGLTIASSTTVQLGAAGVIPDTCVVTTSGTLSLNGFDETIKSISGTAGTFSLGANKLTLDNPAGESFSSAITGTGGKLVKNGSGNLILSPSTGTYDGGLTLNSGAIGVGSVAAFGTGTLTIGGNATISANNTSSRAPTPAAVVLSGNLTSDDTFNAAPGAITWGAAIPWTITGGNRSITISRAAGTYTVTINGVIGEDVVGRTLTKLGTRSLTLGGANTYSGGTIVTDGTLTANAAGALPSGKNVTVNGGTLSIAVDQSVGNVALTSGTISGAGVLNTSDANWDTLDNGTVSCILAGVGKNLNKSTSGSLALNGLNTYSGNTTINLGTVSVDADGTLGDGTGTLNLAGGDIRVSADRGTSANNIPNPINMSANAQFLSAGTTGTRNFVFGGLFLASAGTITVHEDGTGAGPATFNLRFTNGVTIDRPITFLVDNAGHAVNIDMWNSGASEQTYSGVISGPGTMKRSATTANTGGKATLAAQNTFTGGVSLNDGELSLGADCTGAAEAVTAGPLGVGSLTMGNDGGKLSATGGARTLLNHVVFTATGTHLTFMGANDLELAGNMDLGGQAVGLTNNNASLAKISGVISNGASLDKRGAGTLTLSGINTYSGATTISDGTLALVGTGSLASTNVTVASGATLNVSAVAPYSLASGQSVKGNGNVIGAVVVASGATVAPGTSIGTLTFDVAPTLVGNTAMELNKAVGPVLTSDKLVVQAGGGTLTYGGNLVLSASGLTITNTDSFDLFDADTFAGSFAAITSPGAGLVWNTSQLTVDGTITAQCDGTLAASPGISQTTCNGAGVVIGGSPTASGGSGTGYTYLWSPSTGLSSATVANPIATPTSTTTYTVTVTDSVGCSFTSAGVTVTVDNTAPAISAQPANTVACEGSTAAFSVTASAPGTLAYSWTKISNSGWGSQWTTSGSGSTFRGSSTDNDFGDSACNSLNSAFDVNSPSGNALGMWGGFSGDQVATRTFPALTVGQVVSVDIDNGNVDTASKVGFSLQTSGGADVLQFYFEGGDSNYTLNDGAETDTAIGFQRTGLRVQVVLNSASTYHVIVTPCGGSASHFYGNYSGTIAQLKVFNQNNTGGSDKNIYFNNLIVGKYVDNADNYAGDYAGLDKGDAPINTGNGSSTYVTPALTVADSGSQYQVVVSSCSGTIVSTVATLTVNPRPTSVVSGTATICGGDSAQLTATLTGTGPWDVYWSDGVTQTGVGSSPATRYVNPTTLTVYTVTNLTDVNCTAQAGDRTGSATITVNTLTANTVTFQRTAGSSLKINLSQLMTNASDTLNQTITFLGVGTDGFNLTSTNGAVLQTNATFIGYPGSVTPNVSDRFGYLVTDTMGCTKVGTIIINVVSAPGGLAQSIDTSGGSVTVTFAGIPNYQYAVERAEDVGFSVNVTTLLTTNAPANGQFSVTDSSPPQPTGYYRLKYNP